MKKHRRHRPQTRPDSYQVNRLDQNRFRGDIATVFYNVVTLIIYSLLLKFTINDTTGLITFFVFAVVQIIVCAIIGINYNSKMWLYSALTIFLIGCGALVYVNM